MSDYTCFKYRAINKHLLDSLVKSHLYFAPRNKLNDPFDCNVNILSVLNKLIGVVKGGDKKRLEKFRDDADTLRRFNDNVDPLGICSFSLTLDETLMWSHYANDHKGISLRYSFSEEFLDNQDEILGVSEVVYKQNVVSNWLESHIGLYDTDHKGFIITLLQILLTSKAPSWSYEKEVRIIRPILGLYEIPRESLTHIIFGLQTTKSDELLIRSIADKYYGSIEFGRVVKTNDDFGIDTARA